MKTLRDQKHGFTLPSPMKQRRRALRQRQPVTHLQQRGSHLNTLQKSPESLTSQSQGGLAAAFLRAGIRGTQSPQCLEISHLGGHRFPSKHFPDALKRKRERDGPGNVILKMHVVKTVQNQSGLLEMLSEASRDSSGKSMKCIWRHLGHRLSKDPLELVSL